MRPLLAAEAARQSGLITRRQAILAGCTERELRTATAVGGPWVVVRRGVYLEREVWEAADERHQWLWRDRAAQLTMRRPHLLSHDSAARAADLSLLRPKIELSHVTRPGVQGSRTEHGVKHHLTRLSLAPAEHGGLRTTELAHTALDLAREHGLEQGAVAVSEVLRRGVPPGRFDTLLAQMTSWPHITRARAAVEHADPGCESVGEVLTLLLLLELGVGVPRTQLAVRLDDGSVAWCDLCIGCHVVEFDGKVKYLGRDRGGVADRDPAQVAWSERQREKAIMHQRLGVSRVIWADLWGAQRERTTRRLLADIEETRRRFGPVLPPHLRDFDARMRRQRVPWTS